MAETRESLAKDEDFLADIREYAYARYGEGIASDQEAENQRKPHGARRRW